MSVCYQIWAKFNLQLVLCSLIVLSICSNTFFARPIEDQSEIQIEASLGRGRNSQKLLYTLQKSKSGDKKLDESSDSSTSESTEETEDVREVPKHIKTLYSKGHPSKTNKDKSENDKNFERFSQAYLDVVNKMQRICSGSKRRHRKRHVSRGSDKSPKSSANEDLLSLLCQD